MTFSSRVLKPIVSLIPPAEAQPAADTSAAPPAPALAPADIAAHPPTERQANHSTPARDTDTQAAAKAVMPLEPVVSPGVPDNEPLNPFTFRLLVNATRGTADAADVRGEDTDKDCSRNHPAKAVNRKDQAAKPPAHGMTIKKMWKCLKDTKTPDVAMRHIEAYCNANANATCEGMIAHLEQKRKTDDRIQPGTIDKMRRFLANARAGVDPLGPPPPPPDPWWVSAPGP